MTSRQWRLPVGIAAVVLAGGALIAWLQPAGSSTAYLDPGNTGPSGGHALAAILSLRGEQLTTASTAAAAQDQAQQQARQQPQQRSQTTILVTSPWLLTSAQLSDLSRTTANLVLADPDQASLAALAPAVTVAEPVLTATLDPGPGCTLPAATLAGDAELGGTLLSTTAPGAQRCYPAPGGAGAESPSLVSYTTDGRRITVLGTGAPLTNQNLGNLGNAALALNLLTQDGELIWLVPAPAPAPAASGGQASFTSLIPAPVYMVAVQLLIAVALLALWRARRLGPLVPERLPAVVRAAETTEGHGRLYHARRSRGQAAQALRDAAAGRMLPKLGLPPGSDPETTAATLAQRTGEPAQDITGILSGPPPRDDAALVSLAGRLDELERKAGAR